MVTIIRAVFLILFIFSCFHLRAESTSILRDTFTTVTNIQPLTIADYIHWAKTFEAVNDHESVDEILYLLDIEHFGQMIPTIDIAEQLLAAFPQNDNLLNKVAWIRYLRDDDIDRAYTLIRQIKQYNRASHDSYAMIALKKGFPAEALQRILPLLIDGRLNVGETYQEIDYLITIQLFDHAGIIFYKNQLLPEAYRAWREAYAVAQFLIQRDYLSESMLLTYDYNHHQTQKRLSALRQKLKQINAASGM